MSSNNEGDIVAGIIEGFHKMDGKPKSIYTDDEAAFSSKALQTYYEDNNIQHIITRLHAPYAERAIRTIKNMLVDRLENTDKKQWAVGYLRYYSNTIIK